MKKILLLSIFLITGCTELGEPSMHPSDWTSPDSDDSHMAKIAVTGNENCRECHGGSELNDFYGGTSGVSCYECHDGGPSGHPDFSIWVGSPDNAEFHGNDGISRCVACHGDDYSGGTSGVSCYTCHEDI